MLQIYYRYLNAQRKNKKKEVWKSHKLTQRRRQKQKKNQIKSRPGHSADFC